MAAAAARRISAAAAATTAAAAQFREDSTDKSGSRDGNANDGQEKGFLGNDGNSEQRQNTESSQLNLQQTQQREEFLQDLLLLSALFNDQGAHGLLDIIRNSVRQAARSSDKVPAQRAFSEEVLGTVQEKVLQSVFAGFDGIGQFDFVRGFFEALSGTIGSSLGKGQSSEEVDILLVEESLSLAENLRTKEGKLKSICLGQLIKLC